MSLRVHWRSSPVVTHGDIWLPLLSPSPVSYRPINSSYTPRYRPSWAVTVVRLASMPSRTCVSSSGGAPTTIWTRSLRRGWISSGTCAGCKTYADQPSTVSRRLSVVVGFYRVCVIDAILEHSPADYVRRPTVPAESPTLGLGHLQFEALITTARTSSNVNDSP
jgi:hypothetical protein